MKQNLPPLNQGSANLRPMSPIIRVPSSSPRQIRTDNLNEQPQYRISSKSNQLREMIDQLEDEKNQFEKTRQHLTSDTDSVNQLNDILKEAINDRKVLYEEIVNKYNSSIQKLVSAQERNDKMDIVCKSYKQRLNMYNRIRNESSDTSSNEQKELNDEVAQIRQTGKDLMKRYPIEENNFRNYKVLMSLTEKLNRINTLFSKEASNFSKTGKSQLASDLQNKLIISYQIKLELNMLNKESISPPITDESFNKLLQNFHRCVPIYKQLFLIQKSVNEINIKDLQSFDSSAVLNQTDSFDDEKIFSSETPRNNKNKNFSDMPKSSQTDSSSQSENQNQSEGHSHLENNNDGIERSVELSEELEILKTIIGYQDIINNQGQDFNDKNFNKYNYLSNSKARQSMFEELEKNCNRALEITTHYNKRKKNNSPNAKNENSNTTPDFEDTNQVKSTNDTKKAASPRRHRKEDLEKSNKIQNKSTSETNPANKKSKPSVKYASISTYVSPENLKSSETASSPTQVTFDSSFFPKQKPSTQSSKPASSPTQNTIFALPESTPKSKVTPKTEIQSPSSATPESKQQQLNNKNELKPQQLNDKNKLKSQQLNDKNELKPQQLNDSNKTDDAPIPTPSLINQSTLPVKAPNTPLHQSPSSPRGKLKDKTKPNIPEEKSDGAAGILLVEPYNGVLIVGENKGVIDVDNGTNDDQFKLIYGEKSSKEQDNQNQRHRNKHKHKHYHKKRNSNNDNYDDDNKNTNDEKDTKLSNLSGVGDLSSLVHSEYSDAIEEEVKETLNRQQVENENLQNKTQNKRKQRMKRKRQKQLQNMIEEYPTNDPEKGLALLSLSDASSLNSESDIYNNNNEQFSEEENQLSQDINANRPNIDQENQQQTETQKKEPKSQNIGQQKDIKKQIYQQNQSQVNQQKQPQINLPNQSQVNQQKQPQVSQPNQQIQSQENQQILQKQPQANQQKQLQTNQQISQKQPQTSQQKQSQVNKPNQINQPILQQENPNAEISDAVMILTISDSSEYESETDAELYSSSSEELQTQRIHFYLSKDKIQYSSDQLSEKQLEIENQQESREIPSIDSSNGETLVRLCCPETSSSDSSIQVGEKNFLVVKVQSSPPTNNNDTDPQGQQQNQQNQKRHRKRSHKNKQNQQDQQKETGEPANDPEKAIIEENPGKQQFDEHQNLTDTNHLDNNNQADESQYDDYNQSYEYNETDEYQQSEPDQQSEKQELEEQLQFDQMLQSEKTLQSEKYSQSDEQESEDEQQSKEEHKSEEHASEEHQSENNELEDHKSENNEPEDHKSENRQSEDHESRENQSENHQSEGHRSEERHQSKNQNQPEKQPAQDEQYQSGDNQKPENQQSSEQQQAKPEQQNNQILPNREPIEEPVFDAENKNSQNDEQNTAKAKSSQVQSNHLQEKQLQKPNPKTTKNDSEISPNTDYNTNSTDTNSIEKKPSENNSPQVFNSPSSNSYSYSSGNFNFENNNNSYSNENYSSSPVVSGHEYSSHNCSQYTPQSSDYSKSMSPSNLIPVLGLNTKNESDSNSPTNLLNNNNNRHINYGEPNNNIADAKTSSSESTEAEISMTISPVLSSNQNTDNGNNNNDSNNNKNKDDNDKNNNNDINNNKNKDNNDKNNKDNNENNNNNENENCIPPDQHQSASSFNIDALLNSSGADDRRKALRERRKYQFAVFEGVESFPRNSSISSTSNSSKENQSLIANDKNNNPVKTSGQKSLDDESSIDENQIKPDDASDLNENLINNQIDPNSVNRMISNDYDYDYDQDSITDMENHKNNEEKCTNEYASEEKSSNYTNLPKIRNCTNHDISQSNVQQQNKKDFKDDSNRNENPTIPMLISDDVLIEKTKKFAEEAELGQNKTAVEFLDLTEEEETFDILLFSNSESVGNNINNNNEVMNTEEEENENREEAMNTEEEDKNERTSKHNESENDRIKTNENNLLPNQNANPTSDDNKTSQSKVDSKSKMALKIESDISDIILSASSHSDIKYFDEIVTPINKGSITENKKIIKNSNLNINSESSNLESEKKNLQSFDDENQIGTDNFGTEENYSSYSYFYSYSYSEDEDENEKVTQDKKDEPAKENNVNISTDVNIDSLNSSLPSIDEEFFKNINLFYDSTSNKNKNDEKLHVSWTLPEDFISKMLIREKMRNDFYYIDEQEEEEEKNINENISTPKLSTFYAVNTSIMMNSESDSSQSNSNIESNFSDCQRIGIVINSDDLENANSSARLSINDSLNDSDSSARFKQMIALKRKNMISRRSNTRDSSQSNESESELNSSSPPSTPPHVSIAQPSETSGPHSPHSRIGLNNKNANVFDDAVKKIEFEEEEEEEEKISNKNNELEKTSCKNQKSNLTQMTNTIISDSASTVNELSDNQKNNYYNDLHDLNILTDSQLIQIESPISTFENVETDSSELHQEQEEPLQPVAVDVQPVSDSDDENEYDKDKEESKEKKKESWNENETDDEKDPAITKDAPLLVPLDDGVDNSRCANPSSEVNVQRSGSSRGVSPRMNRNGSEEDENEDIESLPVAQVHAETDAAIPKPHSKGGKRIKYKLKVYRYESGRKEIVERTKIPEVAETTPPSTATSENEQSIEQNSNNHEEEENQEAIQNKESENKNNSKKTKKKRNKNNNNNKIATENGSDSNSINEEKSTASESAVSAASSGSQKRRMRELRHQISNLQHHLHLLESSCTDIVTQIELHSFNRFKPLEMTTKDDVFNIDPSDPDAPVLADQDTQTPEIDLNSITAEIVAYEKANSIQPVLEDAIKEQNSFKLKLRKKKQQLEKQMKTLEPAYNKLEVSLAKAKEAVKNHIPPATRKKMELERQIEDKKKSIEEKESIKKQKMKNVSDVRIRIKDVQCCIDMTKKKIQEQLKMPKQNVPTLMKKLDTYKAKEKDSKKQLKMLKIEEARLTDDLKEVKKMKKVDEVKMTKQNEQMKLKIDELKSEFINKLKSAPQIKDIIIPSEIEFLQNREITLNNSIKEKNRLIKEQKNKILALAKALKASQINFPRNAAAPLPF